MKRVKIASISLDEIVSSKSKLNKKSLNCSTGEANFLQSSNTYVYNVTCGEEDSDASGHKVSIQLLDDPTQVEDKRDIQVKVNCSCPAFLYQGGQFNLANRDALLGNPRGKLVPPKERDPVRVNYGCKHIFSAIRSLLDKFKAQTPVDIIPEEDEEEKEPLSPFSISPFKPAEEELPDEEEKAPQTFKFEKRKVDPILLTKNIDTGDAVEEMEQNVIPTVEKETELFEEDEDEQGFSTFRTKDKINKEDAILEGEDEGQNEEEEDLDAPFTSPKDYYLTPKHIDDEDEEDLENAKNLRELNRKKRQQKINSIFGEQEEELQV